MARQTGLTTSGCVSTSNETSPFDKEGNEYRIVYQTRLNNDVVMY